MPHLPPAQAEDVCDGSRKPGGSWLVPAVRVWVFGAEFSGCQSLGEVTSE